MLLEQVRAVHDASRRTYGSPRVHLELRELGVRCARKRVARLMRADGRRGACRRRFRAGCTRRDPAARPAPDLIGRVFAASRPNLTWVADVTYVPTRAGWLYLAVVLDVCSRMVLGWSMRTDRVRLQAAHAHLVVRHGGGVDADLHPCPHVGGGDNVECPGGSPFARR